MLNFITAEENRNLDEKIKMSKITKPIVQTLATGTELITKQMQANAGDLLPKHYADMESMLFIHEGECIFYMDGEEQVLKPNEAITIPAMVKHQIKVTSGNFKGVHFMPKDIKFTFFK